MGNQFCPLKRQIRRAGASPLPTPRNTSLCGRRGRCLPVANVYRRPSRQARPRCPHRPGVNGSGSFPAGPAGHGEAKEKTTRAFAPAACRYSSSNITGTACRNASSRGTASFGFCSISNPSALSSSSKEGTEKFFLSRRNLSPCLASKFVVGWKQSDGLLIRREGSQ